MKSCPSHQHPLVGDAHQTISRRDFLKSLGAAAVALAAAGCQPKDPAFLPQIKTPATNTSGQKSVVSIARANSYEPGLVRQKVQELLDGIGGLQDVLAHGNRVAIKVNMTGGVTSGSLPGVSEIDSFITHPEVVHALGELLIDSGVKDLYIVEAAYEPESWTHYGYADMVKPINAKIVDLTYPDPYKDFVDTSPGANPNIYDKFKFNPLLTEIDAFISVSKMKCHNTAGVTHTMKNLFGLVPYRFYTLNSGDKYRSGFHGPAAETGQRLPGVIIDLNRARTVNLSLVDGILASEGGEGPWIKGMAPIKPGLMVAGKDPVATDSVATAVMSFDPTAEYPNEPFVHANNHINLAAKAGLGTNKLAEIKVVGPSIDEVKMKFAVSY